MIQESQKRLKDLAKGQESITKPEDVLIVEPREVSPEADNLLFNFVSLKEEILEPEIVLEQPLSCLEDTDIAEESNEELKERKSAAKKSNNKTPKTPKTQKDSTNKRTLPTKAASDQKMKDFYGFNCKVCSESHSTFEDFASHMKEKHGEESPMIECCGKKIKTRHFLLVHFRDHMNPQKITCKECNETFRDRFHLHRHRRKVHTAPEERDSFVCDVCSKELSTAMALTNHKRTHLPAEEREKFKTFKCTDCDKAFETKTQLNSHCKYLHTERKAGICEICAKSFSKKESLRYHYAAVHSNGVKFDCHICNKSYSIKDNLRAHIKKRHKEAGSFVCDACGKESPNLTAHRDHIKRVHTGERSYKCDYCPKAFKSPLALKEHTATHTGGALYRCEFCGKTYNSNSNMYNHKRKNHAVEMAERKAKKLNAASS